MPRRAISELASCDDIHKYTPSISGISPVSTVCPLLCSQVVHLKFLHNLYYRASLLLLVLVCASFVC